MIAPSLACLPFFLLPPCSSPAIRQTDRTAAAAHKSVVESENMLSVRFYRCFVVVVVAGYFVHVPPRFRLSTGKSLLNVDIDRKRSGRTDLRQSRYRVKPGSQSTVHIKLLMRKRDFADEYRGYVAIDLHKSRANADAASRPRHATNRLHYTAAVSRRLH